MAKNTDDTNAVIIKKYANRRLYNTSSSSYITLDDLSAMVRENIDFQVVDARSGDDITHSILTQIIMDEEANGEQMLPVSFLRELIGMYGKSMQAMMPQYLEASMAQFRANQDQMREAFERSVGRNPFAKLAETNMAMMMAATEAFMPNGSTASEPREGDKRSDTHSGDELAALRDQMAAMQKKLDELGK
ncbi:polyhydroxyalkanoate synthesis repressor PhaR [Altererythrobacter aurantiacus]|uniref:Polyhydroxyalkanoate synthesis repressor PhaR n=1 Tax=Parapontixanthobacter aurantiacus TaxID=1463599 RepID=A0A844ZDK8_9SPHN|nr:polyhydroxyalkanoate synthesis repressor PhaR [Parapontixanthobacter aurantiacus]MXO85313.1 polyhydroxyalkanoate synthesis repressor PhaR [Parapontixanthobacter aurantiacus]